LKNGIFIPGSFSRKYDQVLAGAVAPAIELNELPAPLRRR